MFQKGTKSMWFLKRSLQKLFMILGLLVFVIFYIKLFQKCLLIGSKESYLILSQSAFVPSRLDHWQCTYSIWGHAQSKSKKKRIGGLYVYKIWYEYRMWQRWHFLEAIKQKLGFGNTWINLMKQCVRSVTFSIMINGEPTGLIKPTLN